MAVLGKAGRTCLSYISGEAAQIEIKRLPPNDREKRGRSEKLGKQRKRGRNGNRIEKGAC